MVSLNAAAALYFKPLLLELSNQHTYPYGHGRIAGIIELIDNIFAMALAAVLEPITQLFTDTKAHLKPDFNQTDYPVNLCFNQALDYRIYNYRSFYNLAIIVCAICFCVTWIFYTPVNNRKKIVKALQDQRDSIMSQTVNQRRQGQVVRAQIENNFRLSV